jgi:hypothetical protein
MLFKKKKMDETPKINPNPENEAAKTPEETVAPPAVEAPDEVEELEDEEQEAGICPECKGRGLLDPETLCDNCEGSGKV